MKTNLLAVTDNYHRWPRHLLLALALVLIIWYKHCLPDTLFNDSTSTVLLDNDGHLLGARIANDGQWRFAPGSHIPARFETCLLQFEDRGFYSHMGVSAKGTGRAVLQNLRNKRVVSGGSTITMQLVRIMRKNPRRTVPEKAYEMVLATRLEMRYSKKDILGYYTAHAPFGNNVVGIDAAAWRYFGRSADMLSWAECATLAVLPNAPGLIYPGKNHQRLMEKRNRLLKRLYDIGKIDQVTFMLALAEPLPDKPLPLPQEAPHLLARLVKDGYQGQTIKSTVNRHMQARAAQVLQNHMLLLSENRIYNGAILITSVKTGQVVAYVGNTTEESSEHSNNVDCITAPRSTGSILKPFLYEKSMEDGLIAPNMLLSDIPTQFGGFAPKNFSKMYDGAVPAGQVLARSLNIPMVRLLNEYGLEKFHRDMKGVGLTTLNKPARHYGLSLILGGAEATLWDLNNAYLGMAQVMLKDHTQNASLIGIAPYTGLHRAAPQGIRRHADRGCVYQTLEAMVEVNRPDEYGNWRAFSSARKIAWKTGTSFGFRDAWAIGVTPDYVVSVWIGNADGEGRPGLTGIKAAAPILFDVFAQLPKSPVWFRMPQADMRRIAICRESGHRASELCTNADSAWVPATCLNTVACPYHQVIHLSKDGKYRVDSECEEVYNMKHETWFVMSPLVEKYYRLNHPNYRTLPDYKPDCLAKIADRAMALLYPKPNSQIYVPVELDGKAGSTIFEAAHRNIHTRVYWHLDGDFIGETREIHQLALNPSAGSHKLTLVDENGITVNVKFEVLAKPN